MPSNLKAIQSDMFPHCLHCNVVMCLLNPLIGPLGSLDTGQTLGCTETSAVQA